MNIKQNLLLLTRLYKSLTSDAADFLKSSNKVEAFKSLVEQRELVLNDIDITAAETANYISKSFSEYNLQDKSIVGVIKAIRTLAPEYEAPAAEVLTALEELVKISGQVEEHMKKAITSSKQELAKIRKYQNSLRGYRPGNQSESRFINKIK